MRTRLLLSAGIVIAVLEANALRAQSPPAGASFTTPAAPGQEQPVGPSPEKLQEIVVTAQKRAQNLQDVPISIEVVGGKELQNKAIIDLSGLAGRIPNFQFNRTTLTPQVYIRGFGSATANLGFEQSVSLYADGIYNGRSTQFNAPLYDLERVEVLRGPQGALLGKNTAAGAINLVSANPGASFVAGTDALYNFERAGVDLFGFASGPVSENLSARLAVKYTDLDGYVRNVATGKDDPSLRNLSSRLTVRFAPAEGVDITGKLQVDRLRNLGSNLVSTSPTAPDIQPVVNSAAPFGVAVQSRQNGENGAITANVNIGEHVLTSVSGYAQYRFFHTTPGGFVTPEPFLGLYDEHFDQFSQELRVASPTGRFLEYIGGVYFDTSTFDLRNVSQYNVRNTLIGAVQGDFDQDARTWSGYAQVTLNLTDALRLQGGLRYTKNKKSADYRLVTLSGAPIAAPRTIDRQFLDESKADPSLTVQYDLTRDVMVYATFAEGSKGGGFASQTRTVTPDTFSFGQEKSMNYELGIKATLLDQRLAMNLTAFRTRIEDLQVSTFVPSLSTFVNQNAASATSKGFEGAVELALIPSLRFSASAAYDLARYDDFPGAACTVGAPATCTAATNNLAGFELIGASKWSGTAEAVFDRSITNALRLGVTAGVEFRSGYFISTDYSPVYGRQAGYTKLNARIELGEPGNRWTLALIGRNLSNKVTSDFAYLYTLASPAVAPHALAETRTISLQASYRF